MLYESFYIKIFLFVNDIIVYLVYGVGFVCGKNMMKEIVDIFGNQKSMNYVLNQLNKEVFVEVVIFGLILLFVYFGMNVLMNKKGYDSFEEVFNNGMKVLIVEDFEVVVDMIEVFVFDICYLKEFFKGFIL